MARPWRIQYEGAYYYVLSRGNERRDISIDDGDRKLFLDTLGEAAERLNLDVFAFVLMDNHYHLLLRTNLGNLSKAMQWLGLTYARRLNNRPKRSGHLFQGRFNGNEQIGRLFGISYSAVSHVIADVKRNKNDPAVRSKFGRIISQFKMCPPFYIWHGLCFYV